MKEIDMNEGNATPPAHTAVGAAEAGTDFVPEAIRHVPDDPAAWSQVEDYPPTGQEALERLPDSGEIRQLATPLTFGWFTTVSAAVLVLVVACTLAAWTVFAHRATHVEHSQASPSSPAASPPPPPITITVTPTPSAAETSSLPAAPAPSVEQQTPDTSVADAFYIHTLDLNGIQLGDWVKAIKVGHYQCDFLKLGGEKSSNWVGVQTEYPALSEAQAKTVERVAILAYCPEYLDKRVSS
ncbi:DUF732 domain-containing protein [Mycobacterium sherrisii]|uniref:DUF732 domain-containing protein n=1 Tax=Mycobacterium sherrisii TaxID=243061 RepID=UPI002DDD5E02|nr:DUF732 domain-containing protein [Mycobacterium sherrisii]MEC4763784.1 DUF732 domain-containing protein [Mycobacterium sherrisii]